MLTRHEYLFYGIEPIRDTFCSRTFKELCDSLMSSLLKVRGNTVFNRPLVMDSLLASVILWP